MPLFSCDMLCSLQVFRSIFPERTSRKHNVCEEEIVSWKVYTDEIYITITAMPNIIISLRNKTKLFIIATNDPRGTV